jgi:hypothetical protein
MPHEVILSIIPQNEWSAAVYIILLTVGIVHTVKFILKTFFSFTSSRRKKILRGAALLISAILAYAMWPDKAVAPWWAVCFALGPASNLLFSLGMKPVEAFFPSVAAVLNFDKTKRMKK